MVRVSLVSASMSLGAGQRQLVEKSALVRGTDHFGGFHGASPAVVGAFHGENGAARCGVEQVCLRFVEETHAHLFQYTVHGVTGGVEPVEEAIAGVHVEGGV